MPRSSTVQAHLDQSKKHKPKAAWQETNFEAGSVMKCLVKEDLNKQGLVYKSDMPLPAVGFDEVRIKVLATAICGTDKSIYHSDRSEGIRKEMQRYLNSDKAFAPIVVGHEFCGIVDAVGEGVNAEHWQDVDKSLVVEPGDYVTAEMHLACGHCQLCRTGNEHICQSVKVKGVHLDGCFAQYVVVPYKNVILLGKGGDTSVIPPRIGALMDAFGNAVHTVEEADVRGKTVAILGAGPLGLMAVFLCKTFGASRIYLTEAVDIEQRFKLAKEFGATDCFDISKGSQEVYDAITANEKGANGVDVVLEMSGAPSAYDDAFRIVRNGGKVVLLGIAKRPLNNFDIAHGVIWKGVTIQGIFGRRMFDTWETMLRLLKSPEYKIQAQLEKLIHERTYSLEQVDEVFSVLDQGKAMKLIFTPQE
jgi:threonine 3-dehydrogenase